MIILDDKHLVLVDAALLFGPDKQVDQAIEEMSELIQALLRDRRGRTANIHEEVADVIIMMAQMRILFGEKKIDDAIKAKIERLEKLVADIRENRPSATV